MRCSSLPLLFRCPQAAITPAVRVVEPNAASETGTAAHEALQRFIETGVVDLESLEPETAMLVRNGMAMWKELGPCFPLPVCEHEMAAELGGVTLTGHADVLSEADGVVRILDWKSGRVDTEYADQVIGYGALALAESNSERAELYIAWLRDKTVERHVLTRDGLDVFESRLWYIQQQSEESSEFHSGAWCQYCPRAHECPGYGAIVRRDAQALQWVSDHELENGLASLPTDRLLQLDEMSRRLHSVSGRVREAIKAHVARHGPVQVGDWELAIEQGLTTSVSTAPAWPVLLEHLDDDEMASVVRVSLTRAKEVVASKAPPRCGAKAKRELVAALNAAGALITDGRDRLVRRRVGGNDE